MSEILEKLSEAVELGKVDRKAHYPPHLKGFEGSYEITGTALDAGITPGQILDEALIPTMERVGRKFSEKKIFVPQMLMSAKAMGAAMVQLKPYFISGEIKTKGSFIMGTVRGDLHDIGKNLVSIMIEGGGWRVIDLGVDVNTARFLRAIEENPGSPVGISALLTTTMENMKETVASIKEKFPGTLVLVGGAPVNERFCKKIGADFYSPDPQGAVNYLSMIQSKF
ncbi:MAG: cobalamin-dependent protein [Bacteroidales bacterium]|nr:cobalamin-dependent protein [Bacteroidales bacterium]MBK8883421.1 cobalamin-dependent protein [Bacteroidales bacterium]